MGRALAVFLIFLFPLHVFADLASMPVVAPTFQQLETKAESDKSPSSFIGVVLSYEHAPAEPPAGADLHDSVAQHIPSALHNFRTYFHPSYIGVPEYLLVLPLIKPPPVL